jgi:hypothetical protein
MKLSSSSSSTSASDSLLITAFDFFAGGADEDDEEGAVFPDVDFDIFVEPNTISEGVIILLVTLLVEEDNDGIRAVDDDIEMGLDLTSLDNGIGPSSSSSSSSIIIVVGGFLGICSEEEVDFTKESVTVAVICGEKLLAGIG